MDRIFTSSILISAFSVKAQNQYKDFVVSDKNIIGLTGNGKLIFFDKEKGKKVDSVDFSSKAVLLTKDKLGKIVIVDDENRVKRYLEDKNIWEQVASAKTNIYGVLFDSKNTCYLITENGIKNTKSEKQFFSEKSLNQQIHYKNKWGEPYTYYIDKNDKIWLGFGYGEWGGNVFIFDIKTKEFLTPNLGGFIIELWPIISFFEAKDNVFLSSGLQHRITSGILVKFDNINATEFYESTPDWSEHQGEDSIQNMSEGECIGPATYNRFNNSIYYYSQEGIKKGDLDKDLSKKENWELVIKPKLQWKYGQPDAVGASMNVLKLEILDENRLIFLSQNDGIGVFNGNELIMLKKK